MEIIFLPLCANLLGSNQIENAIKQNHKHRESQDFLHGKPTKTKGKITGPNSDKPSIINSNVYINIFSI